MTARRPPPVPPPPPCDERLLVAAAQRDPSRFTPLYELHFNRVYAYVVTRVQDRATAEDLTSDVFHRALTSLPGYEWRGAPFAAWLYRIAANAIADHCKRITRNASASIDPDEPMSEDDLLVIENRARLFQLVSQLPDAQRYVIHARFIEQRSIREISRQLGKSEGAVKQLQFRALQLLRKQMEGSHA